MTLSQVIAGDLPRFLQFSEWLCIIVSLTAHSWRRNFGICFGQSKISVILFLLIFSRASEIYMFVKRNGRMIPISPQELNSIKEEAILSFQSPLGLKIRINSTEITFIVSFQRKKSWKINGFYYMFEIQHDSKFQDSQEIGKFILRFESFSNIGNRCYPGN